MTDKALFDDWPEWYDRWFTTPIGKLVKETETELVHELVNVKPGEKILDAGCGTGIFTQDFLSAGAEVIGLDISLPMLYCAGEKVKGYPISLIRADILCLPFKDNYFLISVDFLLKILFTKRHFCGGTSSLSSLQAFVATRKNFRSSKRIHLWR